MKKYLYSLYFTLIIITSLFYTSSPVYEKSLMLGLVPLIGAVGLISMYCIFKKEYKEIKNKNISSVFILVIAYIIASFVNQGFSFRELYFWGAVVFGIIIIGDILISYDVREITRLVFESYVVISILVGLFGVYSYINKLQIWSAGNKYGYSGEGTGILSIMSNVNAYGLVCVIAMMISTILYFMYKDRVLKIIMGCNVIFQGILMIMTGSRTVLLILASFCISYFIFFYKNKYKKKIFIISSIIILLLIIGLYLRVLPQSDIILNKIFGGDFTTGRVEIWSAAFIGIKENLIFGVGIRNCLSTIGLIMGNPENGLGAHNGYIALLLANGLIVFLSVMAVIFSYIKSAYKRIYLLRKEDKLPLQLMVCFCISMLFGNMTESILFGDFNFPTVMLWIMLMIINRYPVRNR